MQKNVNKFSGKEEKKILLGKNKKKRKLVLYDQTLSYILSVEGEKL